MRGPRTQSRTETARQHDDLQVHPSGRAGGDDPFKGALPPTVGIVGPNTARRMVQGRLSGRLYRPAEMVA